jgi:hypothetical protein
MISVHKFLGILARNKKYTNFLIIGRHGDEAFLFSSSFFSFKSFYYIWRESKSCTNRVLKLAIFCATKSEVSCGTPPQLFSCLFVS